VEFVEGGMQKWLQNRDAQKRESANNVVVVLIIFLKGRKELSSSYGHPKQLDL